jgi:hypothetical protein
MPGARCRIDVFIPSGKTGVVTAVPTGTETVNALQQMAIAHFTFRNPDLGIRGGFVRADRGASQTQ